MLRQSLDPVKIPLDRMRIKRRQKLLRNKILMLYDMQLRVIHIQPFRYMSPGNKMDLPHPRCILLNAPEPVLQVVPVPVTLLPAIYMTTQSLSNQRLILFFLPFWVISIYPGNYKIYWFFFSLCFLDFPFLYFDLTACYYVPSRNYLLNCLRWEEQKYK